MLFNGRLELNTKFNTNKAPYTKDIRVWFLNLNDKRVTSVQSQGRRPIDAQAVDQIGNFLLPILAHLSEKHPQISAVIIKVDCSENLSRKFKVYPYKIILLYDIQKEI